MFASLLSEFGWIGWAAIAVEWAIRIGLVLRLLLRRSPGYDAISWIAVIALVPVLGLLVYVLVGETPLGRRRHRAHDRLERQVEQRARQSLDLQSAGASCPMDTISTSMIRLGTKVSGLPALGGNALELMDDAPAVLRCLAEDIRAARHHVHLMYYIWGTDEHAAAVYEELIAAAKRGVTCRALADAVGSRPFWRSRWPRRLRDAGVRLSVCLPVNPLRRRLHRIDLRNHRKLAIIDSATAYIGSQNLVDERVLFRRRPRRYKSWIDTTVRLRGPAILPLQSAFLGDWLYENDEDPGNLDAYLSVPRPEGEALVHVLPSGPGGRADAIHQTFLGMLHTADREVVLTTPYFVPDTATRLALANAALRGVRVLVIVPDELDSRLVEAASRAYLEDLLDAGVRIAHHRGGLLHAKTAVIDRKVAMISSANFDRRSFWLNFELTMLVYDAGFAQSLWTLQRRYLGQSLMVRPREWRLRPWPSRLRDNAAALLSPLL